MSVSHRRGARSRYIVASWLKTELLRGRRVCTGGFSRGRVRGSGKNFERENKIFFMKAWGEKGRWDFPERKKSLPGGHGSWIMTKGDVFCGAQTFVKIFPDKFFVLHIIFFRNIL